ncbi:hypothetical protein DSO57_1019061 [Entomophthora muscae]|uniref:Uncharacterized protein n=1 Tax=Entomophthora muscae TaxID=34485 RepID=A0ACC2U371_9FUNG|nr:hypothetical protein DSO57_1019061 [Entomophthora muscae]
MTIYLIVPALPEFQFSNFQPYLLQVVLAMPEYYNSFLTRQGVLNPSPVQDIPKIPSTVDQGLFSAEIRTFSGLHRENTNLWIQSTQSKFTQAGYP